MARVSRQAVEAFLKDNPDFTKTWFVQHASDDLLQSVLASRSDRDGAGKSYGTYSRNSITGEIFQTLVSGDRASKYVGGAKHAARLKELPESEVFMELIRDIANELDVNVLCHKILTNVSILTGSDRGSLFLARGPKGNRYLVSKLFDVTESSTLEATLHKEVDQIKVPFGVGIAGHVALTKEVINIKDAYSDPRFNQEVDKRTGYKTHSICCTPIVNFDNEVIGVAQIINKKNGNHEFTEQDVVVFKKYLVFCGIGLTNAQLFEISVQEFKRNEMLVKLARNIFQEQTSLERLVQKIMIEAQDMLKCARCCVYITEDSLITDSRHFTWRFIEIAEEKYRVKPVRWAKDVDKGVYRPLQESPQKESEEEADSSPKEIAFAKAFDMQAGQTENIRILNSDAFNKSWLAELAKEAAMSHQILNIPDVENDPRCKGKSIDADFHVHSVLCVPIYTSGGKVVGVAQMMNKMNGQPFYDSDVNIFEAFGIFCGLGIHNTQMYENACKLMAKQSVALEVLSYHATAPEDETNRLKNAKIPSVSNLKLYEYTFDDMPMSDDETAQAVVRMFLDLDLVKKFRIPYEVMCRWTLTVKKNYRPITYHNWRHAFNVAQMMFALLTTGDLKSYLTDIEMFGLLVASLSHDLDHRGTNNAFQSKIASPLAHLYSTSTLEHHHFDHCIMIFNSEGNNILQSFSPKDYKYLIRMLEHAILSTDLALYFKKRGDFQTLVDKGENNWGESMHNKELLRGMMMTACDVAAVTKPWKIQKAVAVLVFKEFFEQGDIEKNTLHQQPIAMMDREKEDELPKMQVGFIDAICIPVYRLFSSIKPGLKPLLEGCERNRVEWQRLADEHERKTKKIGEDQKNALAPSQEDIKAGRGGEVVAQLKENAPRKKKTSLQSTHSRTSIVSEQAKEVLGKTRKKNKSKFCSVL